MIEKKIATYTTCGYKMKLGKSISDADRKPRCYFIYNSINFVVAIPSVDRCYHTVDATYGEHQTSVPITEDKYNVYFDDKDLFVFT